MKTDKEMLDWLSQQPFVNIRRSYQPFVDKRTKKEQSTGGYSGKVNLFTIHSQHVDNCKNLRSAISKAMSMKPRGRLV